MQSSRTYRPRTFNEVVGQEHVLRKLTKLWQNGKFPNALLFSGQKGIGKTSVARIISVSVQCEHEEFGNPCLACRKKRKNFPIYELNASETTGVKELKEYISGSTSYIIGMGKFKVYVLDEPHRLSDSSQNLLLKKIEDSPKQVLWILCTTRPDKLLDTVRDRCRSCRFAPFGPESTPALVRRLLKKHKSQLSSEALTDVLLEQSVTSGRSIANAVDNYVVGLTPEEAAMVDVVVDVKTKPLCRAVIKGDWAKAAMVLKNVSPSEIRLFRAGVFLYLMAVLLDQADLGARTMTVAEGIMTMTTASYSEIEIQAAFCAVICKLCKLFAGKGL